LVVPRAVSLRDVSSLASLDLAGPVRGRSADPPLGELARVLAHLARELSNLPLQIVDPVALDHTCRYSVEHGVGDRIDETLDRSVQLTGAGVLRSFLPAGHATSDRE
jgi:hypothetical protein